jgi:hypothetical protein
MGTSKKKRAEPAETANNSGEGSRIKLLTIATDFPTFFAHLRNEELQPFAAVWCRVVNAMPGTTGQPAGAAAALDSASPRVIEMLRVFCRKSAGAAHASPGPCVNAREADALWRASVSQRPQLAAERGPPRLTGKSPLPAARSPLPHNF